MEVKKNKTLYWMLAVVFLLLLILLATIVLSFLDFRSNIIKANTPVIDIQQYPEVLNEWKDFAPEVIAHFPSVIPFKATNVDFYYFPGFLQSGTRIELRFQIDKTKINAYYEEFKKVATKCWYGDTWVHRRPPHEGESEIIELPKDFEIMQFDENPDNLPEHSKEHGVAISKENNEIIFWAEW